MAGCVQCFLIPLLLFIFHYYIQPIILKFWNPWKKSSDEQDVDKEQYNLNFGACPWTKRFKKDDNKEINETSPSQEKVKAS